MVSKSRAKNYNRFIKYRVIHNYSKGKMECASCGFSNTFALTIDHINGGGNKHRKKLKIQSGKAFYIWLIKNNFPDGYQVLCMNCQFIKRALRNECNAEDEENKVSNTERYFKKLIIATNNTLSENDKNSIIGKRLLAKTAFSLAHKLLDNYFREHGSDLRLNVHEFASNVWQILLIVEQKNRAFYYGKTSKGILSGLFFALIKKQGIAISRTMIANIFECSGESVQVSYKRWKDTFPEFNFSEDNRLKYSKTNFKNPPDVRAVMALVRKQSRDRVKMKSL